MDIARRCIAGIASLEEERRVIIQREGILLGERFSYDCLVPRLSAVPQPFFFEKKTNLVWNFRAVSLGETMKVSTVGEKRIQVGGGRGAGVADIAVPSLRDQGPAAS